MAAWKGELDLGVWGEALEEAATKSDSKALLEEIQGINDEINALLEENEQLIAQHTLHQADAHLVGITPFMSQLEQRITQNQEKYWRLHSRRQALARQWAELGYVCPGLPPSVNLRDNLR